MNDARARLEERLHVLSDRHARQFFEGSVWLAFWAEVEYRLIVCFLEKP